MKRLKPFFSYFGSKWRLSPKYPDPIHSKIIEPFAGSACYSLLHFNKEIILYDVYDKIVQLWNYLINVSEKEINKLPLLCAGEEIPNYLTEEQKILIGFWVSKATTRPQHKQSNYKCESGKSLSDYGFWSNRIRTRISSQLKYIRHWKVKHSNYNLIDDQQCTWFIDPPYQIGGEHYKHNQIDYSDLSTWCKNRKGQIIVCENNDADWLPFVPFYTTKGLRKNTSEVFYHQCDYTNLFMEIL